MSVTWPQTVGVFSRIKVDCVMFYSWVTPRVSKVGQKLVQVYTGTLDKAPPPLGSLSGAADVSLSWKSHGIISALTGIVLCEFKHSFIIHLTNPIKHLLGTRKYNRYREYKWNHAPAFKFILV